MHFGDNNMLVCFFWLRHVSRFKLSRYAQRFRTCVNSKNNENSNFQSKIKRYLLQILERFCWDFDEMEPVLDFVHFTFSVNPVTLFSRAVKNFWYFEQVVHKTFLHSLITSTKQIQIVQWFKFIHVCDFLNDKNLSNKIISIEKQLFL